VHGKTEILDPTLQAQLINQNPEVLQNLNPSVLSALQDASKIKKKIYIPQTTGVNYIGMLIGPKGLYQKRLEEESGCKILIRGKGSQKQGSAPQPDDEDEQHVLLIADN
jgi:polyribonucleotide nucleotidyltransferase